MADYGRRDGYNGNNSYHNSNRKRRYRGEFAAGVGCYKGHTDDYCVLDGRN